MRRLLLTLWLLLALPALGQGEFRVHYVPAEGQFGKLMEQVLRQSRGFEDLAAGLSQVFILPRNVDVVFAEIGQLNAFYSPADHRIVMGYELIEFYYDLYGTLGYGGEDQAQLMAGATMFVFLHELGHALVHELQLPITGKEEDVADEFATLLLLEAGDAGKIASVAAAAWFAVMSEGDVATMAFWDEHSLNQQRFYDILITLHAADPVTFSHVRELVPEQRLARGQLDYQRKQRAWEHLLGPHIRQ